MICLSPKAIHKGKRMIEIIIDHAHNIIGHFGQFKTSQFIRRYFWWQSMSHDIESYCKTCGTCATSKDENSKPTGLLHSLPIPDMPWQSIGLDFMCKGFTLLSMFSLITIELEPDIFYIKGVLNDSCDGL